MDGTNRAHVFLNAVSTAHSNSSSLNKVVLSSFLPSFLSLFRAAPEACGSSQARGQIGPAAASLPHSHSNSGSKPSL